MADDPPISATEIIEFIPDPLATCGASRSGLCTWALLIDSQIECAWDELSTVTSMALLPSRTRQFPLRGSAYGEALLDDATATKVDAIWLSTRLFGDIPDLGKVVFTYRDAPASTVEIESLSARGEPFFPALATQRLYWTIEVLDEDGHGVLRSLQNPDPMIMTAEISSIPPYGAEFVTQRDTLFFEGHGRDRARLVGAVLKGSKGLVEPSSGLEIEVRRIEADRTIGEFQIDFAIRPTNALTEVPDGAQAPVIWFATGFRGTRLRRPSQVLDVRLPHEGRVEGVLPPGVETAGVVLHALTASGPRAETHVPLYLGRADWGWE